MNKPMSNANNGFVKSLNSGLEQRNQANQSEVKTITYYFLGQPMATVTGTMWNEQQVAMNNLKKKGFKSYSFDSENPNAIHLSSFTAKANDNKYPNYSNHIGYKSL